MDKKNMKKSIITVIGKDSVGIIAKVCTYLANNQINILDISQTITGGYFNMMMVVESEEKLKSFPMMAEELNQIGEEIGCVIRAQHEDIFEMMHRI
jgi:ACT domain-containing protein